MRQFFRWAKRAVFGLLVVGMLFLVVSCAVKAQRATDVRSLPSGIAALQPSGQRESAGRLRVGAYNIAHGRGGQLGTANDVHASADEVKIHLQKIAEQVEKAELDILVLNEIDFACHWTHRVDQAAFLQEATGFPHLATQHNLDLVVPGKSWRFGNAILSRYPLTDVRRVKFPPLHRWEALFAGNHDALFARVKVAPGKAVEILGVHLEVRSEGARVEAARAILELAEDRLAPLIVLGDFNSSPAGFPRQNHAADGENAIDMLRGSGSLSLGWSPESPAKDFSFPSEAPDRAIDWMLVTPELELTGKQVVPSRLSDHLMIIGEVGLASP